MLPMEKSVTFTGTCANEIIPSIIGFSTKQKKDVMQFDCLNRTSAG